MADLAVIIPAFNSAATVGETLRSLQEQRNLSRVLAVYLADDASSDGTPEVARRAWRSRVALEIVRNKTNQGERSTVNGVVAQLPAGIKWFFILHADDIVKPDWIDIMAKEIDNVSASVISLTASYDVLDESGRVTAGESLGTESRVLVAGTSESIRGTLRRGCWFKVSSCAIRSAGFRSLGGFRTDMPQLGDWEFVLRALRAGWTIEYIPLCLSFYRQHKHSVSSKSFREHRDVKEALWIIDSFGHYLSTRDLTAFHFFRLKSLARRCARSVLTGDLRRLSRGVLLSTQVGVSLMRHAALTRAPYFRSGLIARASSRIGNPTHYAFFDVFDTCVTRKWILPTDVFHELHGHLPVSSGKSLGLQEWVELRVRCEAESRAEHPAGEPGLAAIYQKIAEHVGWPRSVAETAMAEEIELESKGLRAVPEIRQRILELRASGYAIIFISDTYHSSRTVARFLNETGIPNSAGKLYVSCESSANKSSGELFDLALRETSARPADIVHTGDNFHSDIKVPRWKGIQVGPFIECRANRYERAARAVGCMTVSSLLPGASRLTRLDGHALTGRSKTIWSTSADVVGPVLFGFVLWCLERARANGLRRLYFVSRDGQILIKIANILCSRWGFDLECRYLFGSRQAWHSAASDGTSQAELCWLFENTRFLSVSSLLKRANISEKKAVEYLACFGFSPDSWDQNLNATQRAALKTCFLSDSMKRLSGDAASESRRNTLSYLRQEGLADQIPYGIVDIGWNGRLHRSLARLLVQGDITPPGGLHGLYFGLECDSQPAAESPLYSYFYAAGQPSRRAKLCSNKALWELFVAADTGGVTGYANQDGMLEPVLSEDLGREAVEWGIGHQQSAVVKFTEYLTEALTLEDSLPAKLATVSEALLEPFVNEPSLQEAEAYGSFQFAEDQIHGPLYELAPKLSLHDSLNALVGRPQRHNHVWLPASARRSGSFKAALLSPRVMQLRRRLKKVMGR